MQFLQEDLKIRQALRSKYADAGVSQVEIDRQANKILVNIYTARPGVVIGRGGQRVDEIRQYLESLIGGQIQLNILEIRQPELDAYLVARSVAEQIERRVAFRRAMKRAIFRTLEAGAEGVRISVAGRLGGAEIARREMRHQGRVPLHKLRADIDYGFAEAHTTLGRIGVKVWIYKGDILPQPAAMVEEAHAEGMVALSLEEPAAQEKLEIVAEPLSPAEVPEAKPAMAASKEVKEKTEKPVRRTRKAKATEAAPAEAERKDVTTQTSEISQEPPGDSQG